MFALVALFGLFHGLIFLPVMLSLIGPQTKDSSMHLNKNILVDQEVTPQFLDNKPFKNEDKNSNASTGTTTDRITSF